MENQSYINNFNFDEKLREKMENFSVEYDAAHWESLNQRLDEDLDFLQQDSLVASKLEDSTTTSSADWAFMSQLLDADHILGEQPESLFDKNVREKVLQTAGRFSENKDKVWMGLENHLDQKEKRRPKVFLMTLAKAAIIVLALLSALQLADMIQKPIHQDIVLNDNPSEKTTNTGSDMPSVIDAQVKKTVKQQISQLSENQLIDLKNRNNLSEKNEVVAPVEIAAVQETNTILPTIDNQEKLPTIAVVEPMLKSLSDVDYQKQIYISDNLLRKEKSKKTAVSVSAFASADMNTFREKGVFNSSIYSNSNIGWSTGVKVGIEKGNWEGETGLAYSVKNYLPEQTVVLNASNETVRQNMIQIPVQAKFKVVDKKRFSIKGLIGSTFNWMIRNDVNKNYYTDPLNPIGTVKGTYANNQENKTYFTLDAGIVAEYKINPKLKICFQPVYQQNVSSGVGLNNEKINTLSFQVAAKTML